MDIVIYWIIFGVCDAFYNSEGLDNRNPLMIEQYHEWLAELIGTYIQNNTIMRDNSIIHYVD